MKKIFIITIVSIVLTGCVQKPVEEIAHSPEGQEPTPIPDICLDFPENAQLIHKPFHFLPSGEGAGTIWVRGTISSRQDNYVGEKVEAVYLVVDQSDSDEPAQNFYRYLSQQTGSSAQMETDLYFKLGALVNGIFTTTADLSGETHEKIIDALNENKIAPIGLRIVPFKAHGAPPNFTAACRIE